MKHSHYNVCISNMTPTSEYSGNGHSNTYPIKDSQFFKSRLFVDSNRVEFNPRNKLHCDEYKNFLKFGKWSDLKFMIEKPFVDVPSTIQHKITAYFVGA